MKFLRILTILSIFITESLCVLRKTAIQMDTIDDKVFSCPCGCTIVTSKKNELILTEFEFGCQTNPTANIMSYRVNCPCGCQGTLKTGDQFYLPPTNSCTPSSYSLIHNDKRLCPCSCLNQDTDSEIKYFIHRSSFCSEGLKVTIHTLVPPSGTNINLSTNSSSESTNQTLPSPDDSIISDKISNITSLSSDSANNSSNSLDTTSLVSSLADFNKTTITPSKIANILSDPLASSNSLKTLPDLNIPSDSSLPSTFFNSTSKKSTPSDVPTNSSKSSLNTAKPALVLGSPSKMFPTSSIAFPVPNTLLESAINPTSNTATFFSKKSKFPEVQPNSSNTSLLPSQLILNPPQSIISSPSKLVPARNTTSDSSFRPFSPINTPLLSINSSSSGIVPSPNTPSDSSFRPSKPIILNNPVDSNITSNSSETLSAPNTPLNSPVTS